MNDKRRTSFQKNLLLEEEEITKEMQDDTAVHEAKAPKEMKDRIFREIRMREAEKTGSHLTQEEQELLRLGKIYKRKLKHRKYYVLVAAVVTMLAMGTISMGEPKKMIQTMLRKTGDVHQFHLNVGDDVHVTSVKETEVYQEIEKRYGFYPVRMQYLPQGISFYDAQIKKNAVALEISYITETNGTLDYIIFLDYKNAEMIPIAEGIKGETFELLVQDTVVHFQKYDAERWDVTFVYKNVGYCIRTTKLERAEIEKIVKNLKFI